MMTADEKIPVGLYACQAGCRGTGLPSLWATGCSTTYRPKTSGILSSEQVNCVMYCFLSLWSNLDQNAYDFKVSNKRRHKKYIGICTFSSLGTNAFRTCHLPWDIQHAHPPTFLAGIFSWAESCTCYAFAQIFLLISQTLYWQVGKVQCLYHLWVMS